MILKKVLLALSSTCNVVFNFHQSLGCQTQFIEWDGSAFILFFIPNKQSAPIANQQPKYIDVDNKNRILFFQLDQ